MRVTLHVKFYTHPVRKYLACKSAILHALYARVGAAIPLASTVSSNVLLFSSYGLYPVEFVVHLVVSTSCVTFTKISYPNCTSFPGKPFNVTVQSDIFDGRIYVQVQWKAPRQGNCVHN